MTQNSPDSNTELLALLPLINRTVYSVTDLKEFGHTKTQLMICTALYQNNSLTMSQIARYISSSKEQATRAVAPLVDDGLAERYTDAENRTKIHVRLTDLGKEKIEAHRTHVFSKIQELTWKKLTQEEMVELRQSAETMIRLLSKLE